MSPRCLSSLLKLSRQFSFFGILQVSRTTDMIFWLVTRQSFLLEKKRLRDKPIRHVGLVIIKRDYKVNKSVFLLFLCNL